MNQVHMGNVLSYNSNKYGTDNATTVLSIFNLEAEVFLYKCCWFCRCDVFLS